MFVVDLIGDTHTSATQHNNAETADMTRSPDNYSGYTALLYSPMHSFKMVAHSLISKRSSRAYYNFLHGKKLFNQINTEMKELTY